MHLSSQTLTPETICAGATGGGRRKAAKIDQMPSTSRRLPCTCSTATLCSDLILHPPTLLLLPALLPTRLPRQLRRHLRLRCPSTDRHYPRMVRAPRARAMMTRIHHGHLNPGSRLHLTVSLTAYFIKDCRRLLEPEDCTQERQQMLLQKRAPSGASMREHPRFLMPGLRRTRTQIRQRQPH